MKSRNLFFLVVVITLSTVALWCFFIMKGNLRFLEATNGSNSVGGIYLPPSALPKATMGTPNADTSETEPSITTMSQFKLSYLKHVTDMPAKELAENLPFKFYGNDAVGRVVDQNGRVLVESGQEIGILGIAVSPNQQMILIEGGDAVNFLLKPSTGDKVKLPVYPPGANMLGFGAWHWISENKLFGESGVQVLNAEGSPTACCESLSVTSTMFYVYDVISQRLSEVIMPSNLNGFVLIVVDVTSDGNVHLAYDIPHVGTRQDLGWFRIDY
jgi:hypothetical protein